MTACVVITPDSRMVDGTSSSCVDNIHVGCLSDNFDPSNFRPGVGLLKKVEVISAYLTAAPAAEMVIEREDRVFVNPPDSGEIVSNTENHAPGGVAAITTTTRDLLNHDVDQQEAHGNSSSSQVELKAAASVDEAAVGLLEVSLAPSVHKQAEEEEEEEQGLKQKQEPWVSPDDAVEFKYTGVENRITVGDLAQRAAEKVLNEESPVKEEAEETAAETEAAEEFPKTVNIDRNVDSVDVENPYSDATATVTATTPVIQSSETIEEFSVSESNTTSTRPSDMEDAAIENDEILKDSVPNLPKKFPFQFTGLNHVAICCESLERSLDFYCGLLGLKTDLRRPDLPYRGAWLLLGAEGIHIMEVPNPDPVKGRPAHGGYDRHACLNVTNVDQLRMIFDKAGIDYQPSMVPSIFCRDPDGNGLEFIEVEGVHVE